MTRRITFPRPPLTDDSKKLSKYIIDLHRELERLELLELSDIPAGGGGSATWGTITGILSSQADLQAALDLKANLSAIGLKLYIQDATPSFGVGEKALWIDTTGSDLNFWVQDGT